ncbi:Ger(x)C family spore germination protein [Paenibacillus sp. GYB003]|uniref:Ger(x)C family spore germination protein n=1 Tax=Paenibacillus sp. GYB003 TaxID=2994392 RepID=UPI002F962D28
MRAMKDGRFGKGAKLAVLTTLLMEAVLLTGCWDRREVNNMAVITAAAIDKAGDTNIELSVQVFNPRTAGGGQQGTMNGSGGSSGSGGVSEGSQVIVRSEVGATMAEAMSKLQMKLSRHIFWGHGEIFIIGEELARKGFREHVDFLLRSPEIRDNADIFISKGPAKQVLILPIPLERSSAQMLRGLTDLHLGIETSIVSLSQMLAGKAGAAVVPLVQYGKSEEKNDGNIPYPNGAGIVKKDKLIGFLDEETMRGAMWIRNEIDLATVTVTPARTGRGFVTVRLVRSETELLPRIEHGEWSVTVKSKAEGDMLQNTTNVDFSNPVLSGELERELAEAVASRMKEAIGTVQNKMNADIFGFSEAFHRSYPKQWNKAKDRWDEMFPRVKTVIETDVKILRQGLSDPGALRTKEEVQSE